MFRVRFVSPEAVEKIRRNKELTILSQEDSQTVVVKSDATLSRTLKLLAQQDIAEFNSHELDLEGEFIEYYGEQP